ncbi:MAG: hypothetical protein QF913_07885 [Nitrospinaceae bacterium]|nr:hypothetical protein [Nitrospinaceae bacterium]
MFSGQKLYIEDKWEPWSLPQRPGFPPGVPPPNGTQPASLPSEVGGDQFRLLRAVGGLQAQSRPQVSAGHLLGVRTPVGHAVGHARLTTELARLTGGRADARLLAGVNEVLGLGESSVGHTVGHEDSLVLGLCVK